MRISIFLIILTSLGLFPSFNFVGATKQDYHGGIPSAGYGTRYTIILKAKTDYTHLSIDKLYVGHTQLDIRILDKKRNINNQFMKGDTLYLFAVKHTRTDRSGNALAEQQWKKIEFPVNFDGEALLLYYLNSKERYLKIKKLKKLSTENRP